MPLQTSDKIFYPSRLTKDAAIQAVARVYGYDPPTAVRDHLTELDKVCNQVGIDYAYAVAHSANETDIFRDQTYFLNRRNGFGIGVTGEPGVLGPLFPSYAAMDFFFVAEMLLKTKRPLGIFTEARQYAPEKYDAVKQLVGDPTFPSVSRLRDLNHKFGPNNRECVWMCDENGPEAIVQKANLLFPNIPNQGDVPMADVQFGNVPHPDYIDSYVSDAQNSAWDDLGQRHIKGIVWHRMLGSLTGTDQFFHGGAAALTDYGVGVAAQDGDNLAGVLYRWNDPLGHRAPWANGALSNPYGDGLAFYNLYGVNAINRDLTAIEISGFQDTPLDAKSRAMICAVTAYWADQYKVSWETFPLIPSENNRSFVIWHQEITIGTGKECPFQVVMNETPSLIEQTRSLLKSLQSVGSTHDPAPAPEPVPQYAPALKLAFFDKDLTQGLPEDHVWISDQYGRQHVKGALIKYTSLRAANRLQGPDTHAEKVGPRTKIGESFRGYYQIRANNRWYVVTAGRSFIDAGTLTPRVTIVDR
jgi:hypothetical protein